MGPLYVDEWAGKSAEMMVELTAELSVVEKAGMTAASTAVWTEIYWAWK